MNQEAKEEFDLSPFYGSEQFYKVPLAQDAIWTEGVQYLHQRTILPMDMIAVLKHHPKVKEAEFVAIKVTLKNGDGKMRFEDGDGGLLYQSSIFGNALPDGEYDLYFTNNTLMLASEY